MYRQIIPKMRQRFCNGYVPLFLLLFLSPLFFGGTTFPSIHTVGTGDLLREVPVVDERTLNTAACGIAAATMVLDYYLPQSGPIHRAMDIAAVSKYVKQFYGYDKKTQTMVPQGTSFEQLQTGIEAASNAPELGIGAPLTASWHTTDSAHWFSRLTSELDAKRPIILFLANGHTLGWDWDYGHFIVVSGYTSDNSIIYHDPWKGKANTLPYNAFATAWGTTWNGNSAWQYMTITGKSVPASSQPVYNFAPFVGRWGAHARILTINADGSATLVGRVFVVCGPGVSDPCDAPPNGDMNTGITFTRISADGKTIYGTITSGNGDRDSNNQDNVMPVGSPISGTLEADDTGNFTLLNMSDGYLLCNSQVSPTDPNYPNDCMSGA